MDLVKLISDYEIWKIANELATDFYPIEYPKDRKDDRDRLIDFKDGLREIKKSKHKLKRNLPLLDKFLSYMNPKRKWTYSDESIFESLYRIEIRSDDLFDLCERGDVRFGNEEIYNIYRFLFDHEIYGDEPLQFLLKVYDIEKPESIDWGYEEEVFEFSDAEVSRAKRLRKVSESDASAKEIIKTAESLKKESKDVKNKTQKEEDKSKTISKNTKNKSSNEKNAKEGSKGVIKKTSSKKTTSSVKADSKKTSTKAKNKPAKKTGTKKK